MEKRIFDTREDTAAALAAELYNRIAEVQGEVYIALSGGSTPALLFSILSADYSQKIEWSRVKFFWVDERAVPPEDEQSNYRMTAETLLNHINIPDTNVFRIRGESPVKNEVLTYAEVIRSNVPFVNDLPVFDIILLGLGDDGHTASIFPDQMELLKSKEICAEAVQPQSGQTRMTLTGPVINNGRSVYFLVFGKNKEDMVKRILNKDPQYPASFIEPNKGHLYFYLDKEAAGE